LLFGIEQALQYLRTLKADKNIQEQKRRYNDDNNKVKENEEDNTVIQVPDKIISNNAGETNISVCNEQIEYLSAANVSNSSFLEIMNNIRMGINDYPPQKAEDGTSGVYFLNNSQGMKSAVFKPAGEEGVHLAGYSGGGDIKPGCNSGEGYLKEVAAYLLDQKEGFHGVPPTTLAKCIHSNFDNNGVPEKKIGSLQQFITSECTAEDMGWSKFSVPDVHKIGLLDCRIFNMDRHLGNILVTEKDGEYHLVPIDHGLSLPNSLVGAPATFEWLQFPQCKQPFDKEAVDFVCNIDAERDVQMLNQQLPGLREGSVETLKICTLFVKRAVKSGLNLFQIGCMMSRYRNEGPSELERMYIRVKERMAQEGGSFWCLVDEEINATLARV